MQASVLTDSEIRRVFRIIETTRHVERNRLAFVLSIYAGLRVGEIAALTIRDVGTANGDVRREIKLGAHQTKGSKGRTVILSERVRKRSVHSSIITPRGSMASHSLHRSAMVAALRMLHSQCYSRKSTRRRGYGRVRIQGGELSRHG